MDTGVLPLVEASDPSPPLRFLEERGSWSKARQKPAPGELQSSALCDEANLATFVHVPKRGRAPEERERNANSSPEQCRKRRSSREVSANEQALSLSRSASSRELLSTRLAAVLPNSGCPAEPPAPMRASIRAATLGETERVLL